MQQSNPRKMKKKTRLKDLTFDVLAECSSFFEWVRLSKFRVLYTPLQWSEMVAVVGFVLAEGLRVRVRVRSCERERDKGIFLSLRNGRGIMGMECQ